MTSCENMKFKSLEEELNYWKKLAEDRLIEKQELQAEFNDYTEQSRQLEKELEMTLEHAEKSSKDLKLEFQKLQSENEMLKIRLEQSSKEISAIQQELAIVRKDLYKSSTYIRELEQKNDDLERAQRVVAESIAAAELTLNSAIERNAFLESEIDEKEQLKIKLQRLTDEARDLKQELNVRERNMIPDNERILTNGNRVTPIDSNRLSEISSNRSKSPTSKQDLESTIVGSPMTPSARHSALNLVGDILRRMGSLEAKVAACRNRDYSQSFESRYRRLNRATSNANSAAPVQNTPTLH